MINRMVRAFKNDLTLYPELKDDPDASSESLIVLLIIGGIFSVGTWVVSPGTSVEYILDIPIWFVSMIAAYLMIAIIAWVIGSLLTSGEGSFDQVRIALAYGYTPIILSIIPLVGILFSLWALVTISSAIRETLGISPLMTLLIVLGAAVVNIFVMGAIFTALIGFFI